ncbi:MAG: fumarate reductase subunit FrdD [Candidatus Acidiferrales bacterium]
MPERPKEPFFWTLFSAGGVVAAVFLPAHIFLFGLAFPLGWLDAPSYEGLAALARHPLARIYLFVLCSLPLFHWAHRFRYTLYDGLQIKHLNELINVFCYGGAIAGTVLAAVLLWRL